MNELLNKWRRFDARQAPSSPALDAYNKVDRALEWEFDTDRTKFPSEPAQARRVQKLRRRIWDEIELVQSGSKPPQPRALKRLLEELKIELYPLGGLVAPGGRRLRDLIKMLQSVTATGSVARVYAVVARTLREIGV